MREEERMAGMRGGEAEESEEEEVWRGRGSEETPSRKTSWPERREAQVQASSPETVSERSEGLGTEEEGGGEEEEEEGKR